MTKIEQLEHELNESLNVQYLLREALKSNTKTMEEVENLLKVIGRRLMLFQSNIYCANSVGLRKNATQQIFKFNNSSN